MAEISDSTENFTDIFNNQTENGTLLNTSLNINNHMAKSKPVFSFTGFIIFLIDILVITGPSIGYFLQSLKFKQTKSSKGFSKSLCLIMYIAQILRIIFWIGKPFKITLLYQSILIIIFQVYLIYLWVKYHDTKADKNTNEINDIKVNDKKEIIEYFIDWSDTISPNKIWNWSNSIEYFKFMFLIILFLLLTCGAIGIHNKILVNIIGTISVIAEASTLVPQIIVSCKKKDASNLSMSMVALWFLGDSCKFVYNIIYKTPIQMIISGGAQIFLDFFSLMQIICYKKNNNNIHYQSTDETNITTTSNFTNQNRNKVQQINQFMNKLEERFDEEVESNKNSKGEEKQNEENENENDNHLDKNDSKRNINTVEIPEKIEVLDKSKQDNIKDDSDDEKEQDENNLRKETKENLKENKDENENQEEKKEDISK